MAISSGSPREATELAARLGVAFPLIADTDLSVTKAYGTMEPGTAHPRPATFVLDEDRAVLFRHVGANAADRPSIEDVLAAL